MMSQPPERTTRKYPTAFAASHYKVHPPPGKEFVSRREAAGEQSARVYPGLEEAIAVRCGFTNLRTRFVSVAGTISRVDNLLKTRVIGTIYHLDLSLIAANAVPCQIITQDIVTSV
jgi:hypothetical protein